MANLRMVLGWWLAGTVVAVAMAGSVLAQSAIDADKQTAEFIRLYQAGKYSEAVPFAERALKLRESALGPSHLDVAEALNNLGLIYFVQGRHGEAEPLFKRSLSISERVQGSDHLTVARTLGNLASVYQAQGRYSEAEPLFKRSLAIREKALGTDHAAVGQSLNYLANLYKDQGRLVEAVPLYKRSLAIREKLLGADHPDVGETLNNLGNVYGLLGRTDEALPLLKRDLAISEKAFGSNHPVVGQSLNNLAVLYHSQGRDREAIPLLERSLVIREKALGPDHPEVGQSLNNLAQLYQTQGRQSEAVPLLKRSLSIRERALGSDHPDVGKVLNNLAWLALEQGDLALSAENWRRSAAVLQRRVERGLGAIPGEPSKGEAQRNSWYFEGLIKTTHRLAQAQRDQVLRYAADMFEAAQWGQGSEAAASLAQMAIRSAKGDPKLAALVRERQDLVTEWQTKDKLLISAKGEQPVGRNLAAEKTIADRLASIDTRLTAIDARLAREFPDFTYLASPRPISIADAQSALRDDEVLLLFLDTRQFTAAINEETFVWVVTKGDLRWLRSELGTTALKREVASLRCGLDATSWHGDGAKRCAELLKMRPDLAPQPDSALPFDAVRAHALYKGLLGEAEDIIKGKKLLVVPSGALTTLPFEVLVTKPPTSTKLTDVHWLVRDHAVTVLPSVASLVALRKTGKPSDAPKAMIGFGNPLLDGNQADPKYGGYYRRLAAKARTQTSCAKSEPERTAALREVSRGLDLTTASGQQTADLAHLRMQMPLPETADELCAVARTVGGSVDEVRLGARATETEVKRLSSRGELAKFRMVHFATHGTLAGQLRGTSEPGLILTPPQTASPEDDGFLSGSEIAGLKLDADWVILSACNTAGGAGQGEAAEALSGLARVFFYAGARALLVSHWEVDSDAAVKIVTGAVSALAKDRSIGRAEALRRATLTLLADTTRPANWIPSSHPSVWAPFVVVGEGGAGR